VDHPKPPHTDKVINAQPRTRQSQARGIGDMEDALAAVPELELAPLWLLASLFVLGYFVWIALPASLHDEISDTVGLAIVLQLRSWRSEDGSGHMH